MYHCEQCGTDFLNSDEFNAHQQVHWSEKMGEWVNLAKLLIRQGGQGAEQAYQEIIEAIAERVAQKLLCPEHGLISQFPDRVQSVEARPVPSYKYSFEAITITISLVNSGKSVDELFSLLEEVNSRLKER